MPRCNRVSRCESLPCGSPLETRLDLRLRSLAVYAGSGLAVALLIGSSAAARTSFASTHLTGRLGTPTNSETWHSKYRGWTSTVKVVVYPPAHATAIPPLPYSHRTTLSCTLNPSSDAVIPVAYTVTNTTRGFPTAAMLTWSVENFAPETRQRDTEGYHLDFSDYCSPSSSATTTGLQANPNVPIHGDFFVFVPNFYSPAQRGGDKGMAAGMCFNFQLAFGASPGVGVAPSGEFTGMPDIRGEHLSSPETRCN
jgi:hypothetical protein